MLSFSDLSIYGYLASGMSGYCLRTAIVNFTGREEMNYL